MKIRIGKIDFKSGDFGIGVKIEGDESFGKKFIFKFYPESIEMPMLHFTDK